MSGIDPAERDFTKDWIPEGGFYETRGQQGESVWEDNAQFDPPTPIVEDLAAERNKSRAVSMGELTAEASYEGASEIYGC